MRLRRSEFWTARIVVLALCAATARVSAQVQVLGGPVGQIAAPPAVLTPANNVAAAMPAGETPLVKSDPDMVDWIAKARQAIEAKEYAEAIKILQALIDKPDAGFVQVDKNARRFLPLRDVALRMLGEIPSEGLERYRRLYDPKARRKLDDAVAAGDLRGIKDVADQYRHTRVGPEAAEALGQWYFDRARFAQAALAWRRLLAGAGPARAPLLTLKTAVAYHLAGDAKQAGALAKELRANYPAAAATLAGRESNLVSALESYLAIAPPESPPTAVLHNTYPGWGGLPTGQAVMPDARAVLQTSWRYPASDRTSPSLQIHPAGVGNVQDVELEGGNVSLRIRQGNNRVTLPLPPLIRPVVVEGLVIYRDDERVLAVDAGTGRSDTDRGWKSQSLPMERKFQRTAQPGMGRMAVFQPNGIPYSPGSFNDQGRYNLTVGGGRVYTVCHFPPSNVLMMSNPAMGEDAARMPTGSSSLAALSIRGQGKLDWIVGWSAGASVGGDAFLHKCTFLGPPTYVPSASRGEEGRLYTTVLHGEAFYLLCLDAATGRLLWKSQVAQTPVVKGEMYNAPLMSWQNTPTAPPAVAEDRVFVTTNTGVTAAFDAQTGQPIWAYQYGAATANPRAVFHRIRMDASAGTTRAGVNPMIVNDGAVITMPVDAADVMAFAAADGTLLWRRARNRYLSFVDEGRMCLAGQGVSVLRAGDGKELWQNGEIECFANPVATTDSLLLSGKGKLWRVSLKDYAVSSESLEGDGLLGNLVSIDGKIIAANALGLCAYFDYDKTHAGLSRRMEGKPARTRIDLLLQRGELSFTAARYEAALKDFAAAGELVQSLRDNEEKQFLQARLRQRRYQTCIALGNREKDADQALSWFHQARGLAGTDQERAYMLIRTARLLERVGRFAAAVDVAQTLGEQFPEEEVVDVRIGPDVNPRQTFGPDEATMPGAAWAYQFIHRLIEIHGREVYAKYDAQARQALQQARRENTPEAYLSIQKRWPLSKCVSDASFAAAEVYYTQARNANDAARADENLRRCEELLRPVADGQDDPHRPSALVAMAIIYTAGGQPTPARQARIALAELPGDTPVAFADIHAPLQNVLHDLEEGKIKPFSRASKPTGDRALGNLQPPLHPIFTLDNPYASLLFDTRGNPIRLGRIVFVQRGDKTLLVDTSAGDAEQAVRGEAMTKIWNSSEHSIYAGISRDGKLAAVADQKQVSVFRTDTYRLAWQAEWAALGCSNVEGVGIGEDRIAVLEPTRLAVFDLATGRERWSYQPSGAAETAAPGDMAIPGWMPPPQQVRVAGGRRIVMGNPSNPPAVSLTPDVADGWIVAPMNTGDVSYVVFNAKNGAKILSRVVVPNRAQPSFTGRIAEALPGDGRWAVAVNGSLALYNVEESNKPVLQTMLHAHRDEDATLLGWGADFLAARTTGETVLLYSLRNPARSPVTLRLSLEGTRMITPFRATFDARRVYVLSSLGSAGRNLGQPMRPYAVQGLAAAAFDPVTGKQLWSRELAPAKDVAALQSVTETRRHLVVVLWRVDDTGGVCLLIDKATGEVVQRLTLPGKSKESVPLFHRRRAIVTDGRLIVETGEGITVFGQ